MLRGGRKMDKKMMIDRPMKILKGSSGRVGADRFGHCRSGACDASDACRNKDGVVYHHRRGFRRRLSLRVIGVLGRRQTRPDRRFDLRDDSFADDFSGVSSVFRGCRRSVSELPASGTSCGGGSRGRSFRHGGGFFAGGRKRKGMRSPQRI